MYGRKFIAPAPGWSTHLPTSPHGSHAHPSHHNRYYFARRSYTLDSPTVPMGARKQAHIRLCGVLVKRDSHFRRKCSCIHRPPITPIAPIAASDTSSQRRASASVGASIYRAPSRTALRRCAAYVATTSYSLLLTSSLLFPVPRGTNL